MGTRVAVFTDMLTKIRGVRMVFRALLMLATMAAVGGVQARDVASYEFPESDAVRATVLGAPPGT